MDNTMIPEEPMGGAGMPPERSTMPAEASKPVSGMEVPVPLEALAMPGEDEKLNNPGEGDPVQLMAEGVVTRIEGEMAFVSIKSVNGKPMDSESAKTTNTPNEDENGDNEFSALQAQAQNLPQRM